MMVKIIRKAGSLIFPDNSAPSPVPPSPVPPSPVQAQPTGQGIPSEKKILAFRTITKLLSLIQQEQPFRALSTRLALDADEEKELSLCTAFATLAVIDREVFAVVTQRSKTNLKVLCTASTPTASTATASTATNVEGPTITEMIFNFLLTRNPREHDQAKEATINPANAKIPGFDLNDNETVNTCVNERWSNANAVHLHILGKLLSMKGASSSNPTPNKGVCTTRLLGHVTSTCYKKMWHRFQHNTLSQPYVRYLKQVGTFDVDISKLDIPSHGTEEDRLFLEKFFVTTKQSFQNRYPALSEQATRRRHENFQLYTKDTSAEFHRLFIFLLDGFGENLDQLVTLGAKEKVKVSSPCSKEFDDAVKLVVTYGYALHKLAHGPALRMHLQTISPLLESNFRSQVKMPVPGPGEEQEQEVDADLKAIQFVVGDEPVKNPLHQFYIDWLRLVVIQFDAVEVLVAFFANPKCPYGRISVQLLETPHGGQELLKWQELLEDDTLFPNTTKMDDSDVLDPSNKAIIEWLCSNIGAHELAKPLVGSWSSRKFGPVISSLKTLQSSKVPGWKESATRLLHQLKGLQDLPKIGDKSYPEIYAEVLSISQSYAFYVALASKTKDSKGDSKGDFNGTMHCEACLASLLFKDANVHNSLPEQMKDWGSVIGVSKLCCPICQYLLFLLGKERGRPFTIRGSHNTFSACTLPLWLPEHIVDTMNLHFGGILRRELIQLMSRAELSLRRTLSTGSRRLSSDSARTTEGGDVSLFGSMVG